MKDLAMDIAEQEAANHETGLSLELHDWKTLNKESMREKVLAVVETIHAGNTDSVDALIFACKGKEMFTTLEKNVREIAEGNGVGKAGLEKFACKLSEAMTGVKFDYTSCGDLELNKLVAEAEAIDKKIKARQDFLKTVTTKQITGNSETGEAWEVMPPIKSGKLGIKCEIK